MTEDEYLKMIRDFCDERRNEFADALVEKFQSRMEKNASVYVREVDPATVERMWEIFCTEEDVEGTEDDETGSDQGED